ncbi:hypothetical protein ACB092_02G175200 [Castanea dentata]
MVLSWLINLMSKDLVSSVIYLNTTQESNGLRVSELRRMVSTLSQDNLSVSSFYTRFKVIWDELVNYKPIPSCSCGICTCGSMVARVKYQEEECTMNFLMGLNESFATVKGQILLMKPLPSLNQVFSLIIQEEKQRRVGSNAIAIESAAIFFRGSNTSYNKGNYANKTNGKRERPICSHYGILGHVVDKCYKIHGYPPRYKNKLKGHSANQDHKAIKILLLELTKLPHSSVKLDWYFFNKLLLAKPFPLCPHQLLRPRLTIIIIITCKATTLFPII